MNIRTFLIFVFIGMIVYSCNKNSLQLPENRYDKITTKNVMVNGVNKIEVSFIQDVDDVEGKTSLKFKNTAGENLKGIKLLIEYCITDTTATKYGSCGNQVIISIDTLFTNKQHSASLPFNLPSLKANQLNVVLLSAENYSQTVSGMYSSGHVDFEKPNKTPISTGYLNGYIAADGSMLIRIQSNTSLYHIKGRFTDTSYFLNGALFNSLGQNLSPLKIDTLTSPSQHFSLSSNLFKFRLWLDSLQTDSTKHLLINLQKN